MGEGAERPWVRGQPSPCITQLYLLSPPAFPLHHRAALTGAPQPSPHLSLCLLHLTLTLVGIILGTHHEKGAFTFWSYAIGLPLPSSSILSWKFCHVLHKVLRDGHPNVSRCCPPVLSRAALLGPLSAAACTGRHPGEADQRPFETRGGPHLCLLPAPPLSLHASQHGECRLGPRPCRAGGFILLPCPASCRRCCMTASAIGATFGRSEICG